MTLDEQIEKVCKEWAEEFSVDLKASLEKALKDGQPLRRGDQEASLNFTNEVVVKNGSARVQILATGDYWINIEQGRGSGERMPPSKKLGAKWQGSNGIQTQQILADIELKYQNSKKFSRLSKTGQRLSKPKKKLSFSEAAKRLSFIFARSIGNKGIPAKPFVDRVINAERLARLTDAIGEITGDHISAELNLNNEFKNIKITI